MINTFRTALALTLAALCAALTFAGPAQSAAPTVASKHASAVKVEQDPAGLQMSASSYQYFTWYWTEGNCEVNGARLQVRGVISNYYCQQSPYLTYYLYVRYR